MSIKLVNLVKFVGETHPTPLPLLASYVTHTKLWLMMFFIGFVRYIRLSAVSLILLYSQLVQMSKIAGLDSNKFCEQQSIM